MIFGDDCDCPGYRVFDSLRARRTGPASADQGCVVSEEAIIASARKGKQVLNLESAQARLVGPARSFCLGARETTAANGP